MSLLDMFGSQTPPPVPTPAGQGGGRGALGSESEELIKKRVKEDDEIIFFLSEWIISKQE